MEIKEANVEKAAGKSLRWQIAQWFERRWWRRYFSGKEKAAYYRWKKEYWLQLLQAIEEVLPWQEAETIADLGCGPAGIFIAFEGKQITAADPLLDRYEEELPFFKKSDFPNVVFVNQTLEAFKPDRKFDIVCCMNAINHVSDIELAYDRLVYAAKDRGYLVVSIDAHNFSFFKFLFRLIPGDILHPHQYDLNEYCQFMNLRQCTMLKKQLIKKEFFFSHYVVVARK